MTDKSSWKWW